MCSSDLAKLRALGAEGRIAAVFHAAALCDYRVRSIENSSGRIASGGKIASRDGALTLHLEPATKVISQIRAWFPRSLIVGWKYELDGTCTSTLERARRQIAENATDECVANGRAYGAGFGFLEAAGQLTPIADKARLCAFLASWLHAQREGVREKISAVPA